MKKNNKVLILVIGALVIAAFFVLGSLGRSDVPDLNEAVSPDLENLFSLRFADYDGDVVNLSDFQGQPLIVNTWATWCPFCVDELPDFVEVQEEFGDQVTFIAINRDEPLVRAKSFTDELGITDSLVFLLDPSDIFFTMLGGIGMPQTIFVKGDGTIDSHKSGQIQTRELRDRIQAIL